MIQNGADLRHLVQSVLQVFLFYAQRSNLFTIILCAARFETGFILAYHGIKV